MSELIRAIEGEQREGLVLDLKPTGLRFSYHDVWEAFVERRNEFSELLYDVRRIRFRVQQRAIRGLNTRVFGRRVATTPENAVPHLDGADVALMLEPGTSSRSGTIVMNNRTAGAMWAAMLDEFKEVPVLPFEKMATSIRTAIREGVWNVEYISNLQGLFVGMIMAQLREGIDHRSKFAGGMESMHAVAREQGAFMEDYEEGDVLVMRSNVPHQRLVHTWAEAEELNPLFYHDFCEA